MMTNSLRRWCRPKIVLVLSSLSETPAHTLQVVSGLRRIGARLFLVQLPVPDDVRAPGRGLPFLVPNPRAVAENHDVNASRQAFLWAEILSEVTVLKNMHVHRIPALAETLGAEMVVLTMPMIGRIPFCDGHARETDLYDSLPVPIMVVGSRMDVGKWPGCEFRRILFPIAPGPDTAQHMRFACRFARRYHGRVTVLHVFDRRGVNEHPWERTPVALEAQLPISELKHEGIMCPMEVAVTEGYPAWKILRFNEERPHDLIILGRSGRSTVTGAIGPSVAETVIGEARCPVLLLSRGMGSAARSTESIAQPVLA